MGGEKGRILTIPQAGPTPMLEEITEVRRTVEIAGEEVPLVESRITVRDRLPEPEDGVLYVVPREVAEAAHGRGDLVYAAGYVRHKQTVVATELRRQSR